MPSTQNGRSLEDKDDFSGFDKERDDCKAAAEKYYEKNGTEKVSA